MRFQVPQFIEVEDKIFGPLTLKQFIYLAGGAGVAVIAFTMLPKFFALLVSAPIIGIAVALAFYKINNKPFSYILEAFFKYFSSSRLYIWKKKEKRATPGKVQPGPNPGVLVPRLSNSKLRDLSWSLDIRQANTPNTKTDAESNSEQ